MRTFFTLKTEYSITRSTIKVKDGIAIAKKEGYEAVALADDGNLFAALDFANEALKANIFPIIGVAVKVKFEGIIYTISLFAKNKTGYENLLFLTSNSVLNSAEPWIIPFEELILKLEGVILLSEITNESLIKLLPKDDFYIEISRVKNEIAKEEQLLKIAQGYNFPIIASNDAYFQTQEMFEASDILKCIGEGRFQLDEQREQFSKNNCFKSSEELTKLFEDLPEAVENANNFKYKISFLPHNSKPLLPSFAQDERKVMEEMAIKGLNERLENGEILGIGNGYSKEDYLERLRYETEVIASMGFCGYFLIVADFINWSKNNDIPVGPGRGSGAGSVIAYSLRITDVDPLYYGLLFERFLNPERVSMPDFDVDFCQEGRERVINYVKEKYGSESVAGIITFGRLQARAVLKDVGRVIQIPYIVTDKICKMIPFNPVDPVTLEKAIILDPELQRKREEDDNLAKLIDIALKLEGLIRHSSTHAAGIIIADRPLIKIVPLFKAEGDDLPAVGYHMKAAENAGLVKFDFLGLKTLTVIANTCKFIFQNHGVKINISKIPLQDKKTFALLQNGFALGVFQLESLICRDSMRKMKIDKIEDIIALTSLNRPGPMENIPSYVNRKLGKEFISYPHPILEELLKETYGIIIYQEQVIKIAQILSGYTLGQADLLRRAMGKKIKEEMEAQRKIFVEGAMQKGVPENKASEIFDLVEKFAGYGFNKSHAAAYSMISYQTAYLKAHYPLEFFTANLNMSISDTDDLNLFINDAKQMGIKVHLPSINASYTMFQTDGKEIFYGLAALKSVGAASMEEMIKIRKDGGQFKDIFDFCKRVGNKIANKKQLETLTKSGAFDCLNVNRKQILESVDSLVSFASSESGKGNEMSLFGEDLISIPKLKQVQEDFTKEENLMNEFEALGFYLSFHPLFSFKEKLAKHGFTNYGEMQENLHDDKEKRFKMAGVVSIIKQRSGPRGRFAFVHLSDTEGIFETAIFKDELISKHRENLVAGKLLAILVSASRQENGGIRIIINDIFPLEEHVNSLETSNETPFKPYAVKSFQKKETKPEASYEPAAEEVKFYKYKTLTLVIQNENLEILEKISQDLKECRNEDGKTSVFLEFQGSKIALNSKYSIPQTLISKLTSAKFIIN
jgi:DNA polymerase-3 subunit alpha